jgi:Fe-S cluster assembly ATPase SufC
MTLAVMNTPPEGLKLQDESIQLLNEKAVRVPLLDLRANSLTVLVGPNGGGKSTFAMFLSGLHRQRPKGMTDFPVLAWQSPELFPGKVRANVDIIRSGVKGKWASAEDVDSALRFFGVFPIASRGVEGLSGGEAQRVCLARAFLAATHGIILDEPTGSLDADGLNTLVHAIGIYLGIIPVSAIQAGDHGAWLTKGAGRLRYVVCITHDRRFVDKLEPFGAKFAGLDQYSVARSFNQREVIHLDAGPSGQGYTRSEIGQCPPSLFWADFFALPNVFYVDTLVPVASPLQLRPTNAAAVAFVVVDPQALQISRSDSTDHDAVEGIIREVDFTAGVQRCFVEFANHRGERVLARVDGIQSIEPALRRGDQVRLRLSSQLSPASRSRFGMQRMA